eukprot:c15367_g1_i1.p1 GENE.c15367_g1_i1~~c15367_g1_i1.p1  ORF type:complete len:302 (-),score=68.19 c15367_g1_i1:40-945(-)
MGEGVAVILLVNLLTSHALRSSKFITDSQQDTALLSVQHRLRGCPPPHINVPEDEDAIDTIDDTPPLVAPPNTPIATPIPEPVMPGPPDLGQFKGHPDSEELTILDDLYRNAYRQGFNAGWQRGETERLKSRNSGTTENPIDEPDEEPASLEDGGRMSEGQAVENMVVEVGGDLQDLPEEDIPEPPDDPFEKKSVNDLNPLEQEDGFTGSGPFGKNEGPADFVKVPETKVSRKSPGYMSPSQLKQASGFGSYQSDYDIDRSALCDVDPSYCAPSTAANENELKITSKSIGDMARPEPDDNE